MKVLMFGWEFPPHISGGLGTACYGLTRGLSQIGDINVLFVVPKAHGDEDQSNISLMGANNVPVSVKKLRFSKSDKSINYIEVGSNLIPYVSENEYLKLSEKNISENYQPVTINNDEARFNFSGTYNNNLYDEIYEYSIVAKVIAKNNEFDIIHAHDWLTFPAGIAAKKISGKPLIIHVHSTDFDRSGGKINPRVFNIEKEGMEMADHIITVSNLTRNIIIDKYGINADKITTVYNAVEPVSENVKSKLKKGVKDKIVTFLGRITVQKGPEYFLEAARLVLKKMDGVRFVMAGSGDMMNDMVKRAAELKIADKVHFTGFLKGDEVTDMLHMSDVLVMPSVSEPFGIVPLEAMQSNVPVIISYQSGVSEVVKYALKVNFWDTYEMADAIYGLLNYPSIWRLIRREGKDEVDNLLWKNSAKNVHEIYLKVLKEKQDNLPCTTEL